jgi:hypothetical protein
VCTLILGVSATGEWINQGGFFAAVADGTRWEAITKVHEYVQLWADPNDPAWSQQFDPPPPSPASASHSCAQQATAPDRVILIGYTDPTDPTYQSEGAWENVLNQVVATIRMKYASVQRIELMTMIRGPMSQGGMTYPGGVNCNPDSMEDIVQPYVDQAIDAVATQNPSLVVAAPKFYVGDCSWWCTSGSGTGPHFLCSGAAGCTDGRPDLAAQMIADYYDSHHP